MNTKIAIRHPELVAIDGADGKIYFGGKTEWFPSPARRGLRGGAVVASEVLSYLAATRTSLWDLYPPRERRSQAEFQILMDKLWSCLTPTARERLDLNDFMEGLTEYVRHAGHTLSFNVLDLPAQREERPSADRCQGFIADALERDAPVAFLTRNFGAEEQIMCNWSLIVAQKGSKVTLADDGVQKTVDFRLWYDATNLGGALVFAVLDPL